MIKDRYEKRREKYSNKLKRAEDRLKRIGSLRLLTAFLAIVIVGFGYFKDSNNIMTLGILAGILVFLVLVYLTNKVRDIRDSYKGLYGVYDMAIKRLSGEWTEFDTSGEEYIDMDHRYTWDLDIFGKSSLFQMINTSSFKLAQDRLAKLLSGDIIFDAEELSNRQDAIRELSRKSWFREKLQSIDNKSDKANKDVNELFEWIHNRDLRYNSKVVMGAAIVLPSIFVLSLIYGFIINSFILPFGLFIVNTIILAVGYKKRDKVLRSISSYNQSLSIYKDIIKHIENHSFSNDYLNTLRSRLVNKGTTASKYIERLNKLTDSISNRDNAYYLIINICLLQDIWSMIRIAKWHNEIADSFSDWIEVVTEFQVLLGFGYLQYENQSWCMPKVNMEDDIISGENIGHPLISKGRIGNDFAMESPTRVMLITGSNMAGKSTFLRSVTINMVLGNIGSCVCAESMTYTRLPIFTCMRVSDNLKRNVSSFFYELLRIKAMNEEAKETKIFFVLDEIFKGTNSYDRHYGAETIIKHFIDYGSIGLVSTHDLELGELENDLDSKLKNYSFSEDYLDNEIVFDYKLKEGISKTRNARKLMEMLGLIDI